MENPFLYFDLYYSGYNVMPLHPAKKEAMVSWKNWSVRRQKAEEIDLLFENIHSNIGVLCGEGSGNLLVFDCDTKKIFQKLKKVFENKKVKIVSSPNGGHIYVKTISPAKTRSIVTSEGKVDIRAQGSYVCSECSIHPTGELYNLESEFYSLVDLHIIPFGPLEGFPKIDILPHSNVETDYKKFLNSNIYYKISNGNYASRSEADFAFIQYFLKLDYPSSIISTLIEKCNYPSKYLDMLDMAPSLAKNWIISAIDKIESSSDTEEFNLLTLKANYLKSNLHFYSWKGQGGASDYKTLMAHLEVVKRTGKNVYSISNREGAILAGLSYPAFNKSTSRLIENKWIKKVANKDKYSTSTFSLDVENVESFLLLNVKNRNIHNIKNNKYVGDCFTYERFGIFERLSVGSAQLQLYNHLRKEKGFSSSELSNLTGKSVPAIRASLRKLREADLISKKGNLYYKSNTDVKIEAIRQGTIDKVLSRSYNYKQQQKEYKNERRFKSVRSTKG